jgi:hypothetical protein
MKSFKEVISFSSHIRKSCKLGNLWIISSINASAACSLSCAMYVQISYSTFNLHEEDGQDAHPTIVLTLTIVQTRCGAAYLH